MFHILLFLAAATTINATPLYPPCSYSQAVQKACWSSDVVTSESLHFQGSNRPFVLLLQDDKDKVADEDVEECSAVIWIDKEANLKTVVGWKVAHDKWETLFSQEFEDYVRQEFGEAYLWDLTKVTCPAPPDTDGSQEE